MLYLKIIQDHFTLRSLILFFLSGQESSLNVEAVEQTYWRNPILRYTQHPLHSPLLPLPYGDVSVHCECSGLQLP